MYSLLYIKRIQCGLTQQSLADQAGVSRRTVCDLERSGRLPTARVGLRLCRALGCGFEEVFSYHVLL